PTSGRQSAGQPAPGGVGRTNQDRPPSTVLKTESLPTPSPWGSGLAALAAYNTSGALGDSAIFVAYCGGNDRVPSMGLSTRVQRPPASTLAHTPFRSVRPLSSDTVAYTCDGSHRLIAKSLNDTSAVAGNELWVTLIHRRPPFVDFQTPFPPTAPCVCSSPTAAYTTSGSFGSVTIRKTECRSNTRRPTDVQLSPPSTDFRIPM